MDKDEKRALAEGMLREKFAEKGELPKRSDFTPQQVCFIKQKLGPWPRALEAAGLKEPQKISSKEKSRLRRERSKRERRKANAAVNASASGEKALQSETACSLSEKRSRKNLGEEEK